MKQKIIARLLSVCMIFSLIPAAAFAVDETDEKTAISAVAVTANLPTEAGKDLPTTVSTDAPAGANVTGSIAWTDGTAAATKTEAGKTYTGTVTLTVGNNAYYFLSKDTTVCTLTVDGKAATNVSVNSNGALTGTVTLEVAAADPTKYAITVTPSDNGTVTANPAEAAEGETVTLTVTPNDGYVYTLKVTGPNGDVDVAENNTFVMPAGNVTVTATFTEVKVEVKNEVDDSSLKGVTEAEKQAVITALKSENTKVDITTKDVADALPKDVDLSSIVGAKIVVTVNLIPKAYTAGASLRVEITPTYQVVDANGNEVSGDGMRGELKNFDDAVTVNVVMPENFVPKTVWHYLANGTREPFGVKFNASTRVASFETKAFSEWEFSEGQTMFTVAYHNNSGKQLGEKQDFVLGTDGELRATTSMGWGLSANKHAKSDVKYEGGYKIDEETFREIYNELYKLNEDINLYEVTEESSGNNGNGGGSGSGGGASSGSNHAISVGSPANGKISVTPANAGRGTTVTVNLTPDAGYVVGTVTVTDANGNRINVTRVNDTRYTFTMPAGRVTVNATFVRADADMPFTDVANGEYYYDAVLWAVANGITTGTSETRFSPNVACTRAQIVTFLWRAAGSPVVTGSNPFTDVASNEYYYNAVLWAVRQGITTGTSASSFSPNATCNRAQTVTFLYRYAGSPAVSGSSSFGDVAANEYYTSAVNWAVAQGVTNGTSTNAFSPANDCTRGHVVTFLYRYMGD